MKTRKLITITILFLFLSASILPSVSIAHPGRTDSEGGHYCRTNCDYWGVPWNEWHSHSDTSPTPAPVKQSSTRISLKASSKKIAKNKPVKLVATIFGTNSKRLPGIKVQFQIKKGKSWKAFKNKTSNSRGNAVISTRLKKSTFFRVVFRGTSALKKSTSRTIKIKVSSK